MGTAAEPSKKWETNSNLSGETMITRTSAKMTLVAITGAVTGFAFLFSGYGFPAPWYVGTVVFLTIELTRRLGRNQNEN